MKEYIIAIELGSSKIVAIAGSRDENGKLIVEAIEEESVINIIKRGCVQNIEDVYSYVKRLKTKLENRLAPAKIEKAYVGIGGVSVFAEDKTVTKTFHEDSIITQAHVEKLKDACKALISSATDMLAIVPVKYIIDGRVVENPIGTTGTNIEVHYKVLTAKPVLRRNIVRSFVERMNLNIAGYIPTALATADVELTNDERALGCVLVDFGAETTTVSIYKNNALVWLETLPMGGRNITRDIASLNLIESEAEHLKIASGMAKGFKSENNVRLKFEGDGMVEIDLAKLSSVVEARSEEIMANVEEQIKRAGLLRKDLTAGVIVVGGAAKMRGWMELLEERIGMKARFATLHKEIDVVEKERSRVNDYLQAVGLLYAAQGACTKSVSPVVAPPVFDDEDDGFDNEHLSQTDEKKHSSTQTGGLFQRIKKTFTNFINEGETEEEKDED